MKLLSKLYTYRISQLFRKFRNGLYTLWIKNFFKSFGEGSRVYYPCALQGGGSKYIKVGNKTCIQSHGVLGCWIEYGEKQKFIPEIIIGDNCSIGEYCQITAINKITISDGLLTGRFVYIGDNSHGGLSQVEASIPPAQRELKSKGEIYIGKNVWIGDKVTILSGVTIGDNVIIGANSVVTHNLPSNCVAVGTPANVVKQL